VTGVDAAAAQRLLAETAAPEPDARMDAYYYGFERTGVGAIDAVLSVLAYAGKAYHHTDDWQDDMSHDYGPIRKGESAADAIQRVANEAAAHLAAALAPLLQPQHDPGWFDLHESLCPLPHGCVAHEPGDWRGLAVTAANAGQVAALSSPAPAERDAEVRCCPGHGSMAHTRGCVNHPEADRLSEGGDQ
jgi:hypothetical protein